MGPGRPETCAPSEVAVAGRARRVAPALDLLERPRLECRVVRIALVIRAERRPGPADVGRDARPVCGQPVELADPGTAPCRLARRMLVAALRRIEGVEAVAEAARALVRHEGVLAPPARAVRRCVQHVEIDERPVAARRNAVPRRVKSVHGQAEVAQLAVDLAIPAAVDPVLPNRELRDRPGPMRDLEPSRAL